MTVQPYVKGSYITEHAGKSKVKVAHALMQNSKAIVKILVGSVTKIGWNSKIT